MPPAPSAGRSEGAPSRYAARRHCVATSALLTGLLVGLALSGCALAPRFERPALPTPASFPGQAPIPGSAAKIGWREIFPDPELRALIDQALANNRDVRIAAARIEQARASVRLVNSQIFPQVDAVATGTRGRTPADLSPTGRAVTAGTYEAMLSAAWAPDIWGRVRSQKGAAFETYLASQEGRRATAVTLIAQVAASYLLEGEYEARITLAQRTIDSRQDSLRIMRRRFEVGSGSRFDMSQAEVLLRQAQLALEGLEGDRAVNRDALALLVGQPVSFAAGGPRLTALDRPLPAGLPSELLVNRPDVVAAEHRLRAANIDIGAARAAFLPEISLTAAGGTASAALERLFGSGQNLWSFTPTIASPLFDAGRNTANLDLAKARRDEAVADYERTIQQAFRDVSDALARRRQLAAQVVTTEQLLAALDERGRLADLRFANGRSDYLAVLDAQRDLFNAQQDLVRLRRAYLASAVSLYAALGGGPDDDGDFASTTQPTLRNTP